MDIQGILAILFPILICIKEEEAYSDDTSSGTKQDEILPFTSSLESESSEPTARQSEEALRKAEDGRTECPFSRHKPSMSLVRNELRFDEVCVNQSALSNCGAGSGCPAIERFCHKEYPIAYSVTKHFSLSVLLNATCHGTRKMRLLSWNKLSVELICHQGGDHRWEIIYKQDVYRSSAGKLPGNVTLIIEVFSYNKSKQIVVQTKSFTTTKQQP